jgi:hypothetical protein
VHAIKNLLWLLNAMVRVDCLCHLIVLSPIEDPHCYEQCQCAIGRLPALMTVEFLGAKTESEVRDFLVASDAMILPTQGENFGHASFESLADGAPVVISNRTIWSALVEKQAGWDLDLVPELFDGAVSDLSRMSKP